MTRTDVPRLITSRGDVIASSVLSFLSFFESVCNKFSNGIVRVIGQTFDLKTVVND